jgi:hypothetical protein
VAESCSVGWAAGHEEALQQDYGMGNDFLAEAQEDARGRNELELSESFRWAIFVVEAFELYELVGGD